jgi:hypothetical protein
MSISKYKFSPNNVFCLTISREYLVTKSFDPSRQNESPFLFQSYSGFRLFGGATRIIITWGVKKLRTPQESTRDLSPRRGSNPRP